MNHQIAHADVVNASVSSKTIWRHVVLRTDTGLTGIGEATLNSADQNFDQRLGEFASHLIGQDVFDAGAWSTQPNGHMSMADRAMCSAASQALWDLRGQIRGVPVYKALRDAADAATISMYANINRMTESRLPQEFADNAQRAAGDGFDAVKIAPFDGVTPENCGQGDGAERIRVAMERIRAVSSAVPDCEVMVDCHWRLDLQTALSLLPELAQARVTWLESPIEERASFIDQIVTIRREANTLGVRLAGLEQFGDLSSVRPFIEAGAFDVIMPDVKYAGSLEGIVEIADEATRFDTAVSLHNPSGPVAHLFSAHVMAAIGGDERMELQWGESAAFFELTDPAPVIAGGSCRPSTGAGLGAVYQS